ncbi:MAG: helix-turn-helix transcriptional regulator [Candidatus Omnitrophota bacterium]
MNRLREVRKTRGLTQYNLAKLAGTYQTRVWQWEHSHYIPRKSQKEALAIALKTTLTDIFPDEQ